LFVWSKATLTCLSFPYDFFSDPFCLKKKLRVLGVSFSCRLRKLFTVDSYSVGIAFFHSLSTLGEFSLHSHPQFKCVWQCGCGCFSNSFSCRNACQWCFWYQHIKTIQKVQTVLNFNKKKKFNLDKTQLQTQYQTFPNWMGCNWRLGFWVEWVGIRRCLYWFAGVCPFCVDGSYCHGLSISALRWGERESRAPSL